jgi:hypothetical protein
MSQGCVWLSVICSACCGSDLRYSMRCSAEWCAVGRCAVAEWRWTVLWFTVDGFTVAVDSFTVAVDGLRLQETKLARE